MTTTIEAPGRAPQYSDIDFEWLKSLEGGQKLKGYVPFTNDEYNNSGVTIASGFDLGQIPFNQSLDSLRLTPALTERLRPYIAERREEARRILDKIPLEITKDEADEIDLAVWKRIMAVLNGLYFYEPKPDGAAKNLIEIPKTPLSVLCSLAWNGGANFRRKWPVAWRWVAHNDWPALQYELNNFYPNSSKAPNWAINRRKKEALYLGSFTGMDIGHLRKPFPSDISKSDIRDRLGLKITV